MKKRKKKHRQPEEPAKPRTRRVQSAGGVTELEKRLAVDVRRIYIEERSAFESMKHNTNVVYRPPKRYEGKPAEYLEDEQIEKAVPPIWLQMARVFVARKIDPPAFIGSIFGDAALDRRAPEPNMLITENSLKCWRRIQKEKEEQIALGLKMQQQLALQKIMVLQKLGKQTPEDAYAVTLLNTGLELSALFRYCLALSIGGKRFRHIAQRFEADACIQFVRYKKYYLSHWKDFLPEKISARMRKVYRYLFAEDEDYDIETQEEES
jgi:hypothetical protein